MEYEKRKRELTCLLSFLEGPVASEMVLERDLMDSVNGISILYENYGNVYKAWAESVEAQRGPPGPDSSEFPKELQMLKWRFTRQLIVLGRKLNRPGAHEAVIPPMPKFS